MTFQNSDMPENAITPLLRLLRAMTPDEREELATLAGTKVPYLYHIATGERRNIGVDLAFAIEEATAVMTKKHKGRLFKVTARDIKDMFALTGL